MPRARTKSKPAKPISRYPHRQDGQPDETLIAVSEKLAWAQRYNMFLAAHPQKAPYTCIERSVAMEQLERYLEWAKQQREEREDEASDQGKLEYLRGSDGQRDRDTIWRRGRGPLSGTGAGGLVEGWLDHD